MRTYPLLLALALVAPITANVAQVYLEPPVVSSEPVTGNEPGLGLTLPDATPEEISAALVWGLRSGLNVAALQCAHSPFLATTDNYNAMMVDQREDLGAAYQALTAYFMRIAGSTAKKAGNKAFDDYNTKSYNGWSTLYGQRTFCNQASDIGKRLAFEPKGAMLAFAQANMRAFRNSLAYAGDPLFGTRALYVVPVYIPDYPPSCFAKNGDLKSKCNR